MKYFIDTEFLEGTQEQMGMFNIPVKRWMLILASAFMTVAVLLALYNAFYFKWDSNVTRLWLVFLIASLYFFRLEKREWKTKPTIDLISIGIVSDDGREYYAISKDFNLYEAWNRYDLKPDIDNGGMKKVYWIRENVLLPIYHEVIQGDMRNSFDFSYKTMLYIMTVYGKTNYQISEDIKDFIGSYRDDFEEPEFYGYFCGYDWVCFCWLFGKMIDLPEGFPMYCRDLKQVMDEKTEVMKDYSVGKPISPAQLFWLSGKGVTFGEAESIDWVKWIKNHPRYPENPKEHHALSDAQFNKQLYHFLNEL
jgi:hypothetical protein